HLPLQSMGVFLAAENHAAASSGESEIFRAGQAHESIEPTDQSHQKLFRELVRALPQNWLELPYKEMLELCQRAFDRTYLPRLIEHYRHNVTKATKAAGVDK